MPSFSPELVALMRTVLEDTMSRVPASAASNESVKVLLAESILKAASNGHTNYDELSAAAAELVRTIVSASLR